MAGPDTLFTEVADRVFVGRFPQWDVNVGAVVGRDSVLVVDTRASRRQGQEALDAIRRLAPDRVVRHVANTHVHFDHTFGNGAFTSATIHAHDNVLASIAADVERIKGLFRADPDGAPELGYTDQDVVDVLTTDVRPPDVGFSRSAQVDLGDRLITLSYAGRGHTDGDIRIAVPDAGVVFLGDLIEESANPALGSDSWPLDWAVTLTDHLAAIPPGVVVIPGHGRPVDVAFVERQRDDLAAVAAVIRERHTAGLTLPEALGEAEDRLPYPLAELRSAFERGWAQLDGR